MKFNVWFILGFLVLIISCSDYEKNVRKKDIIPAETLIPILVDIHLADGILGNHKIMINYPGKDSISNYKKIIESYSYNITELETTLAYYADKPDELEEIYEKVIDNLSKLESEIRSQRYSQENNSEPLNLWSGKAEWHLPADGKRIKLPFNVPVKQLGSYIIRATIKMYSDDGSEKPAVRAWFWYDDGSDEGKRYLFPESEIKKDGKWKGHTITLEATDPHITHLKGFILDHENKGENWSKHADIRSITIIYAMNSKHL